MNSIVLKDGLEITPLKGNPQVVDEVWSAKYNIHIERLDKHRYWLCIGDHHFHVRNPSGKGPGIELEYRGYA